MSLAIRRGVCSSCGISHDAYRALFEDAPVAYHEIDLDGCITAVNAAEGRLLGYAPEEMLGRKVWEFVSSSQQETSRKAITEKLHTTTPLEPVEREYIRNDGTHLLLQIHENRIFDQHGAPIGLRSMLLDITKQRTDEGALAAKVRELARSNAELEQFAYVASHDLQEPLRMVASYTQLLARRYKGKLGADADDFIGFAVDGAQRMQLLINDLLLYSRVGTKGGDFKNVGANTALREALANLKTRIEDGGATVEAGDLPVVWADPTQLTQLLQNLVGNAIKFRNGDRPIVSIVGEESGPGWHFQVRDNGIGIDPQHADRIFQLFQRLHTRAEFPGTGIGLAICKKIVERHGGRIWVESEPGHGATFHFTIARSAA